MTDDTGSGSEPASASSGDFLASRGGVSLGAMPLAGDRCSFRVWAPRASQVEVHCLTPREAYLPLEPAARGYHQGVFEEVPAGSRYLLRLDGARERPDPASRYQPEGIHRASSVVDPARFVWSDEGWSGLPLSDYVCYEIHVGTFTAAGTLDAVIPHLPGLRQLGITALELMPLAQFPGTRNWGYDGVHPFAVQCSYGGPAALARLVDVAHRLGMAVILDVVYNHLGPEGNYFGEFGPYFTARYRTPWGEAMNFDGEGSDEVRRFFIESALYFQTALHLDGLRLDAVHAIKDFSAVPFLEELGLKTRRQAERLGRRFHLIAESDLNDARLIRSRELGGYGLDAQWSDDFHHALHTLLTGEREGYYRDFGELGHLARALREGYAYTGDFSPYRGRRHGNSPRRCPARQFVVCAQNHDQVGNRMLGERLSTLVSFEALKLAATATCLSPYLPLLFMGEEYGETAPFLYFIDHLDPGLVEAVRRGRREEFAAFAWKGAPPDPAAEETFQRCRLDRALAEGGWHRALRELYAELLRLRRTHPTLAAPDRESLEVFTDEPARLVGLRHGRGAGEVLLVLHLGGEVQAATLPLPAGGWRRLLDTADRRWQVPPAGSETTAWDAAIGGGAADSVDVIVSTGALPCDLQPWQALLFARDAELGT